MATLALLAVGFLSLFVFVLFGALLELFRDIRQLRDAAGILDRPLVVDIKPIEGTNPSEYGLPDAMDSAPSAILLFLSERCLTCRVIAGALREPLPSTLWVVAEARNPQLADNFVTVTNLLRHERVLLDIGGQIANRMGLNTTPVGFRIQNGRFVSATTVPSTRYLFSILPAPLGLDDRNRANEPGELSGSVSAHSPINVI
jgi:hypothetical protein